MNFPAEVLIVLKKNGLVKPKSFNDLPEYRLMVELINRFNEGN